MKKRILFALAAYSGITMSFHQVSAQSFTTNDYKKALWMTTRMYGGQRSGENNWLLYNHKPAGVDENLRGKAFMQDKDGANDLVGGWFDCGDHVKFGQTEFYSAYTLLKAYSIMPEGYRDYYSYDYSNYKAANKWNWEDNAHQPNGIPDIVDEVKHATDYFIKVAPNASTFYFQVGDGVADHKQWVTAVKMQTLSVDNGGGVRPSYKNLNDASMPGFCGATLALMSRIYREYDAAYADKCLQHAKYAYAYAKAHPGTAAAPGGFYPANSHWEDEYVDLCAELYFATNEDAYKTEALSYVNNPNKDPNTGYTFDYANNGELAWINYILLGETSFVKKFNDHVTTNFIGKVNGDGLYTGGSAWGTLRYNANAAMMAGISAKFGNTNPNLNSFVYKNIDYIMGKNSQNQSFIVGFGNKYPLHPHHRNIFLNDDNVPDAQKQTMPIPAKNVQFGFMVGGVRSGTYPDQITSYQTSEGGIDYNAGLVGALGYINSLLDPVVTGIDHVATAPDQFVVYPNPGIDYFNLQSSTPVSAKVYDLNGTQVLNIQSPGKISFGHNLNAGLYHVVVSNENGVVKTFSIVKE